MSLLKPNLFVSKLIINCNSVSFLCLVSLKLPFKMQIKLNLYLKLLPVSPVYSASGHFLQ